MEDLSKQLVTRPGRFIAPEADMAVGWKEEQTGAGNASQASMESHEEEANVTVDLEHEDYLDEGGMA